ncbi:MAG TPA: hypothetical protein VGC09_18050 [Rhodopila sp.]
MSQTSIAIPIIATPEPCQSTPEAQDHDLLDPLCRLAGDLHAARALIVAEHGLELMCGLLRRGCPTATVLRLGDKPDADGYSLVFVPRTAALPSSDAVIRLARRALAPKGRLIAGVSDTRAAAALARRLRLNRFSALHSIHLPGLVLLRADLRRPS